MKKIVAMLMTALIAVPFGSRAEEVALGDQKTNSPWPEWLDTAVIYEANLRQGTKTRDLKGLQLELPRLKDLGVDVIWLMPIHPISKEQRKGSLGSYYAVQDYKAVNPEFGTIEDMKEFVRTAHSLGMKVILDEVANHTGADNAWVTEHPEYYVRNEKGEMYGPFDWTDVFMLDYTNPGTREAMADALTYWVKDVDIDGYRCDVAGMVRTDFWEEVRPKLEAIKPVMMLAEADKPELLLNAFDVDYAWPMKDVFNAIAATKGVNKYAEEHKENRPKMNAQDIPALIAKQAKQYPQGSVHMNMVTNHDLNSWEGTEFERYGEGLGAFAVLSYTLPGIPMMYTGQEVGFNHPFEFFEQDPVQPDYTANEFTAFYKALNSLRHNNKAMRSKVPAEFINATKEDILVFNRENDGDRVMVFANLSGEELPLKAKKGNFDTKGLKDYFSGSAAELPATLKPWQYIVLVN